MALSESTIESATLDWLGSLGYSVGHGPDFSPGGAGGEREAFTDVVLVGRLHDAVERLNATIPGEAWEEAVRKVLRIATPSLAHTNRVFQAMLRDGVEVEYPRPDGSIAGDRVRLDDVLRRVPTEHTKPLANLAMGQPTASAEKQSAQAIGGAWFLEFSNLLSIGFEAAIGRRGGGGVRRPSQAAPDQTPLGLASSVGGQPE